MAQSSQTCSANAAAPSNGCPRSSMRAVLRRRSTNSGIQRRRSASDLLAQEIGRESTFRPRYGPPLRAPALVPARANGAFEPKIQAFFVGPIEIKLPPASPECEIFATLGHYFGAVTVWGRFSAPMSPSYNKSGAGPYMGIDTLLLILLVAFGAGFVLNRLDFGRRTRRFG